MNQGKNDLLVNYKDQPTGSARKMHWCHHEKCWFTGSVVLNGPFLKKVTVVSRRPRETAQQTFIWHCLKRGFIGCSGCPLFQKLPFVNGSLWASNKACKVRMFRRKKSKPTALNYKRESEIQSNHSFRLKIGIGELIVWYFGTDTLQLIVRMKVSARYFGTDSFLSLFTFGAMHPFQHANTVQYGQPQPQRQTYIHSATGPHVQMQPQGDLVDRKPSWHVGFV